jgi:hypothetical protein
MDEIRLDKDVSRNASESDSASLYILITTNLPNMVKSSTDGEVTGMCSRQVIRGDREQRASTVEPGTWEIPSDGLVGGNKRPRPIEHGNE